MTTDEVFSRKNPNSFKHNLYLKAAQLPFPFQQLVEMITYDEVFSRKIPNSFAHNLYLNSARLPFPFQQLGRSLLDGRP